MLKAAALTLVAGAVLLVGGQADEAALKKERARLKGTWKIVKLETSKGEDDGLKDGTIVIDAAGTLELRHGDETKKAEYKVNPAAKPPEIDVIDANDSNKIKRGIYELKKDTLKICIDVDDNKSQRPNEFKIAAGSPQVIVTLERAK